MNPPAEISCAGLFDRYLHLYYAICMRTTLNLPDELVARAKSIALTEKTTLTALIVDGLAMRIRDAVSPASLPVSKATGGLRDGVSWEELEAVELEGNRYR